MTRLVPRSIRSKLALYVLLLLAVLLTGLLTSVHLLARRSIWQSFREGLVAEARALGATMEYERGGAFDIEIPDSPLSRFDPVPGCEYYRIFDSIGRSLVVSRSLQGDTELWQPPPNWFKKARLGDAIFQKIRVGGEEKGLLTLKCLPRIEAAEQKNAEGEKQGKEANDGETANPLDLKRAAVVVQVTRSTTPVRHLLRRLRTILLVGGLLTLAAATLGSRTVAHVGLRPVRKLASCVEGINQDTLGTRVPHSGLPKELIPLAAKTNEMLSRLENAFQREKRFTNDAAHEIRTPLSALITSLEVALRKNRTAQEYKDAMTDCLSSARNLNQLTDSLLFLAALDAGKVRPQARPVDVAQFLTEVISIYEEEAKKKTISVTTNVAVPEATLEPDLVVPILNNLISNAIEYCRRGDSISISAYRRDSDAAMCIGVADTGPGIPKSEIEKLFYRFYRRRQQGETGAAHAGLGLAIAAKAAEAMGGRIEVESEVGKGSTFRLVIVPKRPPAAGPWDSNPLTEPGA